jgi:hypothetical protein
MGIELGTNDEVKVVYMFKDPSRIIVMSYSVCYDVSRLHVIEGVQYM